MGPGLITGPRPLPRGRRVHVLSAARRRWASIRTVTVPSPTRAWPSYSRCLPRSSLLRTVSFQRRRLLSHRGDRRSTRPFCRRTRYCRRGSAAYDAPARTTHVLLYSAALAPNPPVTSNVHCTDPELANLLLPSTLSSRCRSYPTVPRPPARRPSLFFS